VVAAGANEIEAVDFDVSLAEPVRAEQTKICKPVLSSSDEILGNRNVVAPVGL
jgi:hypothetical protein